MALGRARPLIWICMCAACLYTPFVNKAVHVDSDMMIHVARQLTVDPLDPPLGEYGRHMALHNSTNMPAQSVFYRCPHPPLLPALLAPLTRSATQAVWRYHLFMLAMYLLAIGAVWRLLGLVLSKEQQAFGTAMWALSPALMVNAQNIMWDMPVAAFIIWSFDFYLYGVRKRAPVFFAYSGLIAGIGMLVKMTVLPLYATAVVHLIATRRFRELLWWMIPALLPPMIWMLHNHMIYGEIHYLSTGHLKPLIGDIRYRFERIISYLGGTILLPVWWHWLAAFRPRGKRLLVGCIAGAAAWSMSLILFLHKGILFSIVYALFASGGLIALLVMFFWPEGSLSNRSKEERFCLLLFPAIYCIMMLFLPLASVRFLLPIAPFAILGLCLNIRSFDDNVRKWYRRSALVTTVVTALLLSYADFVFAEADRQLPTLLGRKGYRAENTWYFGRMSYDWYLHHAGYRHIICDGDSPQNGHHVVEELYPGDYQVKKRLARDNEMHAVDTIAYGVFPVRTISRNAGFYGGSRVPFYMNWSNPVKSFIVYRISQTPEQRGEP